MNSISNQIRCKAQRRIAALVVAALLQAGCGFQSAKQSSNSIPEQLGENIVISATPEAIEQVSLPIYTATIGESKEDYIEAFFTNSKNIKETTLDDGTLIIKSETGKFYTHPAIAMEYCAVNPDASQSVYFDNYSLLFSVIGSLYAETQTRPSGAHYDYLPDRFNSSEDLAFQTIAEAKKETNRLMQQFECYTAQAYRTEVITNDFFQSLYDSNSLKDAAILEELDITDEWLRTAEGYRFFYSMTVNGYPIYRDHQILKIKSTSDGNSIICPCAEMFVTQNGLIYAYIRTPINGFDRSDVDVSLVGISQACKSIQAYFEDSILDSDHAVDIYKIELEYAAYRENENVELLPVYSFYYTQGGNVGCLLINAGTGKLL